MPTALNEGQNYLFFPKGSFTGGKVTGFTNAEVCVLCTPSYIFVPPKKEMSSFLVATRIRKFDYFADNVPVDQGIAKMLSEEDLQLEELESRMLEMLDASNHDRVIKVSELEKFRVLTGILGQARMKHRAGGATKVLVCRGKGAMKAFKAFYQR